MRTVSDLRPGQHAFAPPAAFLKNEEGIHFDTRIALGRKSYCRTLKVLRTENFITVKGHAFYHPQGFAVPPTFSSDLADYSTDEPVPCELCGALCEKGFFFGDGDSPDLLNVVACHIGHARRYARIFALGKTAGIRDENSPLFVQENYDLSELSDFLEVG